MEVILLTDRRNLGRRGERVTVKPGYARNYLLPRGLALEATQANINYFEEQRKKIDAKISKERDEALAIAGELTNIHLTIPKRVGETETLYGSVTASEVADLLEKQGVEVDRRRLDLGGGIKTLGDHIVTIDLHHDVVAEIKVSVVPADQ